jgi:lipid II:glycine glycyltransferase (peptidoglycan interpeptide bridge formation enzyme)
LAKKYVAKIKKRNWKLEIGNWKIYWVVALIVKHDLPFGRSYLYCPRGPVIGVSSIQYPVSSILNFLFDEIKKIAKKEKSLFLKIDPPVDLNLEFGIWNLEDNGLKKSPNEIQPKSTLVLDLIKSKEELLKEMKPKTRYNIRLAGRKKLEIRNWEIGKLGNWELNGPLLAKDGAGEDFRKDFEKFWELIEETSKRDKFVSHSKNYYWKMLEGLSNKICHSELVSESVSDKGLSYFQFVKQGVERIGGDSGYAKKILKQACLPGRQAQDDKQNLYAKLYLAEYNNKIIAANIVLYFGDLAVYLHGASSNEYRNVMAPYLLQWRQILEAKKMGYRKYDFWGIESSSKFNPEYSGQSSKLNSWSGITRFKKGFGGCEKNYNGAHDLVFDSVGYWTYRFARKILKFLV